MIDREIVLKAYKARFGKEPEPVRWNQWKRACDIADMFDVFYYSTREVNYKAIEAIEYTADFNRLERIENYLKDEDIEKIKKHKCYSDDGRFKGTDSINEAIKEGIKSAIYGMEI